MQTRIPTKYSDGTVGLHEILKKVNFLDHNQNSQTCTYPRTPFCREVVMMFRSAYVPWWADALKSEYAWLFTSKFHHALTLMRVVLASMNVICRYYCHWLGTPTLLVVELSLRE